MSTMSDGLALTPYNRLAVWTTKWNTGAVNSLSGAVAGCASGLVSIVGQAEDLAPRDRSLSLL